MSDDSIQKIKALIEQAKREGKELVFGESECAFCGAALGGSWQTLAMSLPDQPPMWIRLCRQCAARFDLETGVFGLVKRG